ncbi:MAG: serine hydrolase domain-containing protein, partial [Stackebrandtia sp.]
PNGHFRIGSVTKTFVATVIAQLVDEGELGWDEPIDERLPGVVPDGRHITVRQLLNHTSGLYDYMHEDGYSTNRWRGPARFDHYEPSELLTVAFAHNPYFAPGEGWHYSNTNYLVLGELIAGITGAPYGEAVRQRVLEPLRLIDTTVPGDDPTVPEPHAHGYTTVDGRVRDATEMNPSLDGAAGEMISTTADLERFFTALLSAELTSADSLSQMRAMVDTATPFDYGLGLQNFGLPCGREVTGHSGELLGYTTYVTRDTAGTVVALSFNPGTANLDSEALMSIFDTVYCSP